MNPFDVHQFSSNNVAELRKVEHAACYYCRRLFNSSQIQSWTDNNRTALCPYCGKDTVIHESAPYPFTIETLQVLHNTWF